MFRIVNVRRGVQNVRIQSLHSHIAILERIIAVIPRSDDDGILEVSGTGEDVEEERERVVRGGNASVVLISLSFGKFVIVIVFRVEVWKIFSLTILKGGG